MGSLHRTISSAAVFGVLVTASVGLRGGARTPASQPQQQQQQPPPQPTPPPGQPPTFRTGINFVRVDAIISDKQGNPVADLQQSDFDITEDGKPQKIDTFKLIKQD